MTRTYLDKSIESASYHRSKETKPIISSKIKTKTRNAKRSAKGASRGRPNVTDLPWTKSLFIDFVRKGLVQMVPRPVQEDMLQRLGYSAKVNFSPTLTDVRFYSCDCVVKYLKSLKDDSDILGLLTGHDDVQEEMDQTNDEVEIHLGHLGVDTKMDESMEDKDKITEQLKRRYQKVNNNPIIPQNTYNEKEESDALRAEERRIEYHHGVSGDGFIVVEDENKKDPSYDPSQCE
jgi:hypothetical protein